MKDEYNLSGRVCVARASNSCTKLSIKMDGGRVCAILFLFVRSNRVLSHRSSQNERSIRRAEKKQRDPRVSDTKQHKLLAIMYLIHFGFWCSYFFSVLSLFSSQHFVIVSQHQTEVN